MSDLTHDTSPSAHSAEIVAAPLTRELGLQAEHTSAEWAKARPIAFCADWRGQNADPGRETRVRALWSPETLCLRFECRYRQLFIFSECDENGRHDRLWDRDVAEVFLQPDPARPSHYKEFEVSPNGMWVDLDIFRGGKSDLKSGLRRSVFRDEKARVWAAELAIPMKALTPRFDPQAVWRANSYRIEGEEPRAYLAWQPTGTPQPNFHVPSAFGTLRFGS